MNTAPFHRAGLVLGLGLGGFVDGILLHQIVHWHNMTSAVVPPVTVETMRINMGWDGVFHAGVWLLTVTGLYWLLADSRRGFQPPRPRVFTGLLIQGWGWFNLVEGVVDHHILELHHVRDVPTHVPLFDWLFLGIGGLGFLLIGRLLARGSAKPGDPGDREHVGRP